MHIPDGYLSPLWVLLTYVVAIAYAYLTIKKIREGNLWAPQNVSKATLLAAAIFVAQMLNWPLPGGTSLHFVGGGGGGSPGLHSIGSMVRLRRDVNGNYNSMFSLSRWWNYCPRC